MRRYPYHLYLTYQVLNGDDSDTIAEHMDELEYVPPTTEDVEELRASLLRRPVTRERREKHRVLFFDEDSPSVDQMMWIVETPPARTCAERLLLDGVHPRHVSTILGAKFNNALTIRGVELFRDGFWDTTVMTPVDFVEYFRRAGSRKPDPPPEAVSLGTRSAYAMWKQGLHPDEEQLSPDAMIREIRVDAFMRFKEASSGPEADAREAKAWAELTLKTAGASKALADGRRGKSEKIPDLAPMLSYPDAHVPTLGELHSEYSEALSGTGAESAAMGEREEDAGSAA